MSRYLFTNIYLKNKVKVFFKIRKGVCHAHKTLHNSNFISYARTDRDPNVLVTVCQTVVTVFRQSLCRIYMKLVLCKSYCSEGS